MFLISEQIDACFSEKAVSIANKIFIFLCNDDPLRPNFFPIFLNDSRELESCSRLTENVQKKNNVSCNFIISQYEQIY